MAFNDREKINRIPYAGLIKLGVMVKTCSAKLVTKKILREDKINDIKIEYVIIKNDPKPEREWEVIRYSSDKLNLFIRVDWDSKERLSFMQKEIPVRNGEPKFEDKAAFPTAVEWFVLDHLPELVQKLGKRPLRLEVMCPSNDIEVILPGLYKNNRGDMVTCVGDGLKSRRMDDNGLWYDQNFCNCGYRTGLPEITVKKEDKDKDSGLYVTLKTSVPQEKGIWRKIKKQSGNDITLEKLEPTCGPKIEIRILLYTIQGTSPLSPYVIRTKHRKTYDYIKYALELVKNGNEQSRGLGFLVGVPFLLKIRIEKSFVVKEGKKIPKDDIVLVIDLDPKYGNPFAKALPAVNPLQLEENKEIAEAEYEEIKEANFSTMASEPNSDPKNFY